MRTRLLACAQYALVAATQLAACNKVHSLEERYARWLLMAHDRVGNELTLTHETSAQILGVRRAGVTVVAGLMANAGIIRYRRGHLDQWHEINRVRMRSCLVVASRESGAYRGILSACWAQPRSRSPVEIELLGTIGSIVELMAFAKDTSGSGAEGNA